MIKSKRDSYYDFLRGLAIIFVVGIHMFNSNIENLSFASIFTRQLINCAVPIFLAISGYFLVNKTINNRADYVAFLKKQIPIVYIPCFIWSIPFFLNLIRTGNSIWISVLLLCTCGISIYYFIATIIQCYVLLPIIKNRTFFLNLVLLAVSIFWGFLHIYYNIIPGAQLPLIIYAAPFPNLLVFFSLGCWLGYKKREYSLNLVVILCLVSLAITLYEVKYLHDTFDIYALGMKTTSHLYDFFFILIVFHPKVKNLYKNNVLTNQISNLGIDSFTIYLIHLIVGNAMAHVPFEINNWPSKWFILLLLSWMAVSMMKKIIPSNYWKYVGLR